MKLYNPKVVEVLGDEYISKLYLRNLLGINQTKLRRRLLLLDGEFQSTDLDKPTYLLKRNRIESEMNRNGLYIKFLRKFMKTQNIK